MIRIENAENIGHIDNLKFYSLYSESLDLFNIPFPAADDETAVKLVVEKAAAASDAALTYGMLNGDLTLFFLSEFDYRCGFTNATANEISYSIDVDLKSRLLSIRKDLMSYVQKVGDDDV